MLDFVGYLHRIELRNTTIAKNIAFVKWFLRWAFGKGYYPGNIHMNFKPKFKGTDGNQKEVIHLTWDELIKLLNFNFDKAYKIGVSPIPKVARVMASL